MAPVMTIARASASFLLAVAALASAAGGCGAALRADGQGDVPGKHVRSLQEIRDATVVRQRWDLSCGSAALSTLLTYDYHDKTPESLIITSILRRSDPIRIRTRGGFSLLDLKRFVEARGYTAAAYKAMTLRDLLELRSPVIVRIQVKGFEHFVVFRGERGDRVMLADPAFGTVTMRTDQFAGTWNDGIGFVIQKREAAGANAPREAQDHEEQVLVPDPAVVGRVVRRGGAIASEMRRGP